MMLNKEYFDSRITVSSVDYMAERKINFGKNVKIIPAYLEDINCKFSKDWLLGEFIKSFLGYNKWEIEYYPLISSLKLTDVVLSIGGDNYSEDYGMPSYYLNLNRLVKKYNKKLIIWGASIGPFSNERNLKLMVESLKNADLITVREKLSFDYLEKLGIQKNIRYVADPAFILPLEKVPSAEFITKDDRPLMGFNISPILERYCKGATNDDIIEKCVFFLNEVIRNLNFKILLIPHVTKADEANNDYVFMKRIHNNFIDSKEVTLISPKYNAMQMKYIISKCDFFIGARTHSTIAALSSNIPTLSIGYSTKAKGINEDIFDSTDFLIEIKDLSTNLLFERFLRIIKDKNVITALLAQKIPKLKALAWKNIEYLNETLRK